MQPVLLAVGFATMVHGWAFLTANRQGGPSGDRDFESQSHVMVVSTASAGGGTLSLLGTFSLEPATIPPRGSPELFQRGEAWHGIVLVDRQHPHDLFVQLAASWERPLAPGVSLRVYLAPRGEPALGPVAFPHRLSASENPAAPLSHHDQDSTHISEDVATLGVTWGIATLEGSAFHGREPDENRWDLEQGRPDSRSARLTLEPLEGLSLQASVGHLRHPEAIEPGDQTRFTASASWEKDFADGFVAVTAAAGRNGTDRGPEWGNLLEATVRFAGKNAAYGRWEQVDRDAGELERKTQLPDAAPRRRVKVDAFTVGFVRDLPIAAPLQTGLGADVTLYSFPASLDASYGSHPLSVHAFLRVRFGSHGGEGGEHHHPGMSMPMP